MELQKAVMNGLQGEPVAAAMRTVVPGWKEPASIDHLLLRALSSHHLPSQSFCIGDQIPASSPMTIGASAGKQFGAGPTPQSKQTLRNLGLLGEQKIVVEISSQPQPKNVAPGTVKLWVQRLGERLDINLRFT